MTATIEITIAQPEDAAAWDEFVGLHGTFYHRFHWGDVIEATYGHRPIHLLARRAEAVVGILPLIDRRSMFFGRALISTGFTVGGGVLASDDEVHNALLDLAIAEGTQRNAKYIELRSADNPLEGWADKVGIYDTFAMAIQPTADDHLKSIPRKKRADVRKGIKAYEQGAISVETVTDAGTFWREYAVAQRVHGTPVFPRSFLDAQQSAFGDDMDIVIVRDGGTPVAGVVNYYHQDTAHLYNAFISPMARARHAGDFMYWWMADRARERGKTVLDFGRSKRGTGSHAYKTYWGMAPEPLVYQYKLLQTDEMPNVNPQNPKFSLMSNVWTRLPLPVANRLGPVLAGHLA